MIKAYLIRKSTGSMFSSGQMKFVTFDKVFIRKIDRRTEDVQTIRLLTPKVINSIMSGD